MTEQPKSGYEAVYWELCRTETAKRVMESLLRWCGEAAVLGYEFGAETDRGTGLATTETVWKVKYGPIEQSFSNLEYDRFRLDVPHALEKMKTTDYIMQKHFGRDKDVKTRNCSADVCRAGKRLTKYNYQRSFDAAFYEYVDRDADLLTARRKAEAQIVGVMVRTSQSDEFARRRHQALCEAAQSDIRKVMLKYREVPDSVLAEAVRQAAVEGVMDW